MSNGKWDLKSKTDQELYEFIAGLKENTEGSIAGREELRKRNESPAIVKSWVAIAIAAIALLISIPSYFKEPLSTTEAKFELRWCPNGEEVCNLIDGGYIKGGVFASLEKCQNAKNFLVANGTKVGRLCALYLD